MDASSTDTLEAIEDRVWTIPAYRLPAFKAKFDEANGKLARAGLDSHFDVTYTEFQVRGDGPVEIFEPWIRAELAGPLTISHGHFTFVARLVPEEGGITVHSAPGQELGGYAPSGDNSCDHCRVKRNRTRLYLVRDERDGSIIQLGHSCIELYTGVAPKGLWALTFAEEMTVFARDHSGGAFTTADYGVAIETVLAYAYAHSDKGRAYVPTSSFDDAPTVGQVRTSLFGRIGMLREPDRSHFIAKAAEAATYLADPDLLDAIKASVTTTSEDSDYGRNLRVILAGERVSGRNIGILASLVKVYARQQQIEQDRKAVPVVAGFIGTVGDRLRNISAAAKIVRYWEGDWGTTTLLVATTDDGHTLVWRASKYIDIEAGDRFTMAAATVKDHDTYRGVDQTVIFRPSKFEIVAG